MNALNYRQFILPTAVLKYATVTCKNKNKIYLRIRPWKSEQKHYCIHAFASKNQKQNPWHDRKAYMIGWDFLPD